MYLVYVIYESLTNKQQYQQISTKNICKSNVHQHIKNIHTLYIYTHINRQMLDDPI